MSDSEDGAFQSADEGDEKKGALGRKHRPPGKKAQAAAKSNPPEGGARKKGVKPQKTAAPPRTTGKGSKGQAGQSPIKSKPKDTSKDQKDEPVAQEKQKTTSVPLQDETQTAVKKDEHLLKEVKKSEDVALEEESSATDSSPITESGSLADSASTNSYVADSEPLSPDTDVSDDVGKALPSSKVKEATPKQQANVKVPGLVSIDRGNVKEETSESDSARAKEARKALDKLTEDAEKPKLSGGWGTWGSWGASLLNTATSSVTTFTSQVGEGFQTVLDTVESSLVEPDPEELAAQKRLVTGAREPDETPDGHSKQRDTENDEQKNLDEPQGAEGTTTDPGGRWLSWGGLTNIVKDTGKNLVSGGEKLISGSIDMIENTGVKLASGGERIIGGGINVIEKTGKSLVTGGEKVIGGGLNVLETIGKKTYDALAEGDHGLKKTLRTKPNLSQTLRDAKEAAENKARLEAEYEEARKAHFGALFDDYNGLVHLEALETVSNQCEGRVQNMVMVLGPGELSTVKHELIIIKEIFQIEEQSDEEESDEQKDGEEDHDFDQQVTQHIGDLGLNISPAKLIEAHHKSRLWLKDCTDEQNQGVRMNAKACKSLAMYDGLRKRNVSEEIHQMAIQSLAELTAVSVQQFHKVAQLVQMKPEGSYSVFKSKSTCLFNLTKTIGREVDFIAEQFTHRLNKAAEDAEDPDSVNPFITNVYLEASNSKTYIQDAFQLLLPVLQHASLQANAQS